MNRLPQYGYLFLLASLVLFGYSTIMLRRERAKKTWPSVPGKVLSSAIVRTTRAYLQTPSVSVSNLDDRYYKDVPVWALNVSYEYSVQGQPLGNTLATASNHVDAIADYPNGPSAEMEQWKNQLAPGTAMPVHYDPSDPQESYLIYTENASQFRTGTYITWSLLLIGIALIAAPRIFH